MLQPTFSTAVPHAGFAAFLLGQERDVPHNLFGDRDASTPGVMRYRPAACGLFGQRGDAVPLPPATKGDRLPREQHQAERG